MLGVHLKELQQSCLLGRLVLTKVRCLVLTSGGGLSTQILRLERLGRLVSIVLRMRLVCVLVGVVLEQIGMKVKVGRCKV